jgi:hypothetical protein
MQEEVYAHEKLAGKAWQCTIHGAWHCIDTTGGDVAAAENSWLSASRDGQLCCIEIASL